MQDKQAPRPEAHQRVAAELIGQRNQALDALAQVAAELGATRDALAAAEARAAELEAKLGEPPTLPG